MNRKFLEQIWKEAYVKGVQQDSVDFQLPYESEAEEVLGFIDEMDLRSVKKMTSPLTIEDAAWLLSKYPKHLILDVLAAMENYRGLVKKYKSAKLTAHNWCKIRAKDLPNQGGNNNVPVT